MPISVAFLEFENFDFLPHARLSLLAKFKCISILMKIDIVNNLIIVSNNANEI